MMQTTMMKPTLNLKTNPLPNSNRVIFDKRRAHYPRQVAGNVVMRWIYHRIHVKKQDCVVAVCGDTGRGKTNVATALAERFGMTRSGKQYFRLGEVPEKITPENFDKVLPDVCYGMRQLNSFWKRMAILEDHRPNSTVGRPVVVEEAQIQLNSRNFRSKSNMDTLSQILTGRTYGNLYLFTWPRFNRIDSQIRELFHVRLDLGEPDRERTLFKFKARLLPDNHQYPYGIYFRERIAGGYSIKKDGWFYMTPPSRPYFDAVALKGRFWKAGLRKGLVDRKTGDYVEELPPKPPRKIGPKPIPRNVTVDI